MTISFLRDAVFISFLQEHPYILIKKEKKREKRDPYSTSTSIIKWLYIARWLSSITQWSHSYHQQLICFNSLLNAYSSSLPHPNGSITLLWSWFWMIIHGLKGPDFLSLGFPQEKIWKQCIAFFISSETRKLHPLVFTWFFPNQELEDP